MAKLILGITGEMGCGKGTVAEHIVQTHKGSSHRFSTMLRDVLERMHIENTRENLVILSTTFRQAFGEDIMAKTMMHDAENDQADIVVIEGVRRMDDIRYLRELSHFKLVYLEAEMEIRYERIIKRGENVDESKKTFEEFQKAHQYETEIQIPDLKNYADYVVSNNGTFLELYQQIDKIIAENLA